MNIGKNYLRTLGIFSLFSLILFSIVSVFPIIDKENEAEATTIPSATSLSLTSSSDVVAVDLAVKDDNGTFSSSDAESKLAFNVVTDNITGYTLTISGSDDSRRLKNTQNDTVVGALDSITEPTSAETFASGNVSDYNNRWGYKPSKYNSSNNVNYLPAPTTSASTIDTTDSANTTANEYTIDLGARVDYNKPAGTYSNTFILAVVGRPASYMINYLDNTGDGVANMPAAEGEGNVTTAGFTLSDTIPTRTGYTFNKWCDGTVTHTNGNDSTCSGTEYASGSVYTYQNPEAANLNSVSLYAMWNVKTYDVTVNFAGAGVSNVAFTADGHDTKTVTISGGKAVLAYNTQYTVTMNFENGAAFVSWGSNNPIYGTLGSTSTNPTTFLVNDKSNNAVVTATAKMYMQDITIPQCSTMASSSSRTVYDRRDENEYQIRYINGGCWMVQNLRFSGSTLNSNTSNVASNYTTSNPLYITWGDLTDGDSFDDPRYHNSGDTTYGYWYNYAGATAGTITGSDSDGTAVYDICPKGWRLPTKREASSIVNHVTAFKPSRNGGYYEGGQRKQTGNPGTYEIEYDYWWTSAYYGEWVDAIGYTKSEYTEGTLDDYSQSHSYTGAFVRCVLRDTSTTISDITNMQDINPDIVVNTANNTTATLTDSRDSQRYSVVKNNGLLWMTRNLAIGCNGTGDTYGSSKKNIIYNESDSNVIGSDINIQGYDYDMLCDSAYGAWYGGFYATVGRQSAPTESSISVCPAGWRIPRASEALLIDSDLKNRFNPVRGGYYDFYNDTYYGPDDTFVGKWWLSEKYYNDNRRSFLFYGIDDDEWGNYNDLTHLGDNYAAGLSWIEGSAYLRCVAGS